MEIFSLSCRGININNERTPHRDVPYTIGRLIATEDKNLKQKDTLPYYLFYLCNFSIKNC